MIKNHDFINYHDDYYFSYYFHLKQIRIIYIQPPYNSFIYTKQISSKIDGLVSLQNKYSRSNLNKKLYEILNKLNNEGTFDDILPPSLM